MQILMFKKFFIIIILTNLILPNFVYGGESGDENEDKTEITPKIQNEEKIKKMSTSEDATTSPVQVRLLKEIKNISDPFNKNLPLLIANRGLYSNADFYSLKSLTLIGILNSQTISSNDVAIFQMPDQRQIVASVGQIIGKEKAMIQAINDNNILLRVNNENILMVLSQ